MGGLLVLIPHVTKASTMQTTVNTVESSNYCNFGRSSSRACAQGIYLPDLSPLTYITNSVNVRIAVHNSLRSGSTVTASIQGSVDDGSGNLVPDGIDLAFS